MLSSHFCFWPHFLFAFCELVFINTAYNSILLQAPPLALCNQGDTLWDKCHNIWLFQLHGKPHIKSHRPLAFTTSPIPYWLEMNLNSLFLLYTSYCYFCLNFIHRNPIIKTIVTMVSFFLRRLFLPDFVLRRFLLGYWTVIF